MNSLYGQKVPSENHPQLNGFQVQADKLGYFKGADEITDVLDEISYGVQGYVVLTRCGNEISVFESDNSLFSRAKKYNPENETEVMSFNIIVHSDKRITHTSYSEEALIHYGLKLSK